jgi:vacuolar-type H+-ATPase subunit I/STV1
MTTPQQSLPDPQETTRTLAPVPPGNPERVFTDGQVQEMMARRARELQQAADARLSEQSKQFETLQDELKQLREFQAQQKEAETARQRAIADEQRRKDEEELSAKDLLRKYREESEQRLADMQTQLAARDALLAKERELQAIRDHAARKILEAADEIMPEFHDYITMGATSIDAVERNIEIAKQKTTAIVEGVRQAQVRRQSGLQPVGTGSGSYEYPSNPGNAPQYSAEQIAGMIPGSEEHLAARRQLAGLGPGGQQNIDISGFPADPRMTAFG